VSAKHFENQLIAWFPSHSKRDKGPVRIPLVAVQVSERFKIPIGKPGELWVFFPANLALENLHLVEAVQSVVTGTCLDHEG
jgi:hypothetical protein